MGCVHGKCCCRYPKSSDGDKKDVKDLGPYNAHERHVLANRLLDFILIPCQNFQLECAVLTQHGYYPEMPGKENQDSFCIKTHIQDNPNVHFFGVFDGHGQFGSQCSNFVKTRLVEILSGDPTLLEDPVKAYNSAFLATNEELHNSEIDDTLSGTTAITVLVIGDSIFVANVGDSRAVISVKDRSRVVAEDLSHDQTPFRKDECERVKLCGARVLSADQVEGLKDPDIQTWGDEETEGGDPPRLWVQNGMYPGTAFTRSVGDSAAEKIGVVAVPEVSMVQIKPDHHPFFVVASDGIFEFLSSQTVVEMAARYTDPRDACSAIAGESYKLWLQNENRTDDITIIIARIKELSNERPTFWKGVTLKGVTLRDRCYRKAHWFITFVLGYFLCSCPKKGLSGSVFPFTRQSEEKKKEKKRKGTNANNVSSEVDNQQSGTNANNVSSEVDNQPAQPGTGKAKSEAFVTPPGSEAFRSVRSDLSDPHMVSTDQGEGIADPSPMLSRPS
ncbi:probable protein phosphatase 2C 35 isoform X1 [Camellia sinensis]|uniref:probable protein phosphatase 2C 35 isoform X1 n=1 Tax=Camellia sinensis TaxID=4442 RepID=UPI001036B5F0|nr:probable protein phosphatase 2C 35 isoform X1 [Camellia sinensis]